MRITEETSLSEFIFWSGATDTAEHLTTEELNQIESMLEELFPNGLTATQLNDFFWFDRDTIAGWLGYGSFEEIMER